MHILSQSYTVSDIKNSVFEKVPRAVLTCPTSRMSLDYHSELCNLKINDTVVVDLYLSDKPTINKNVFLMRGLVYSIDQNKFEASFGGLLMFYEGPLDENLSVESEIYVSVARM